MRRMLYILLMLCMLVSWMQHPKSSSKLKKLYRLPSDTVLSYYDLSNDGLTEFPDLSRYTIDSLDLSHNRLDSLIVGHFPKGIKWLDVSYNCLGDTFYSGRLEDVYSLEKVDLSHNRIRTIGWWSSIAKSQSDFWEDLIFLRRGNNIAGSWLVLDLPSDSISNMEHYYDNGGTQSGKGVVASGRYIQ